MNGQGLDPIRIAILEVLDKPGSGTKEQIVERVANDVESNETAVKREFGKMLLDGEVQEHDGIDGAYVIGDDPRE